MRMWLVILMLACPIWAKEEFFIKTVKSSRLYTLDKVNGTWEGDEYPLITRAWRAPSTEGMAKVSMPHRHDTNIYTFLSLTVFIGNAMVTVYVDQLRDNIERCDVEIYHGDLTINQAREAAWLIRMSLRRLDVDAKVWKQVWYIAQRNLGAI